MFNNAPYKVSLRGDTLNFLLQDILSNSAPNAAQTISRRTSQPMMGIKKTNFSTKKIPKAEKTSFQNPHFFAYLSLNQLAVTTDVITVARRISTI